MSDGQSVLLIEDSETQALLFTDLLENAGMSVTRVDCAEKGLEHLRSNRPDLIVVDFHLPGLRGDEFCRVLRGQSSTDSVPVLILTEDSQSDAEQLGLNCGADDYVSKSSDPDVLLARIDLLARKSRDHAASNERDTTFFKAHQVLVVDDSPTFLAFLEEELKHEGYSVATADCGEKALEIVSSRDFDCLVVDLVMPGMDGIGVCRRLSEYRAATNKIIPVLIVTGRGSKEKMMEALEVGAEDFVEKANDATVLKARIRALLRRKLLQDERQRVQEELRLKEVEIVRERAEKEAVLERARLAAQLEVANKELEAFSYAVSHDLRAPLRSIDGFSQILAEDYAEQLDDEAKALVARVRAATARMGQLIEDMLMLSRVTSSPLEIAPVDLTQIAEEIVETLVEGEPERAVDVTIAPGVKLPCDRQLIRIVLTNLLENAWKYTKKRPYQQIEFGKAEKNGKAGFFVRDNGDGFDMAHADKLYQPFKRLHTDAEFPGTGIGLATVARVVNRHGGSIEADSVKGEGTTFHVTL